ncbi:DUF3429 domain-containing protein [Sulfitobacter sp. TSTF-M16]|uniref:DUF3429 domain-containing protein n=1 Tax=Sulfitobacter aestuariivivens TaxID=2766981 RepID=A0A927D5J0_9RHOB|nr:DUF3429 domain-containing protein [Sulfitobacter aestuariivivens]MBD3664618.1 DUF3429 domain-containing protein [Sulfitobacter aestuariivivens]
MRRVPPSALLLGAAGLIPFVWAALLVLGIGTQRPLPLPAVLTGDGQLILIRYGGIILAFMSGVLWGFATTQSGGKAAIGYACATIPALWWFFMPGGQAATALINLMTGFAALLILDYAFQRWEMAPDWWMSLRIPLTAVVLICLGIGAWA